MAFSVRLSLTSRSHKAAVIRCDGADEAGVAAIVERTERTVRRNGDAAAVVPERFHGSRSTRPRARFSSAGEIVRPPAVWRSRPGLSGNLP